MLLKLPMVFLMILHVLIIVGFVLLGAYWLYSVCKLSPSTTPFVSLMSIISVVILFAYADKLYLGCVVTCAVSAAAGLAALVKDIKVKGKLKGFFTPGVCFFILFSVMIVLWFGYRRPIYSTWDEFSFWGISHRLVKTNNAIYTFYESSMIGNTTPPSLAVLAYFFQFFTPGINEWVSYASYDIMYFAAYAAIISVFNWSRYAGAAMGWIISFFSVYFFRIYTRIVNLEPLYMCTLADIPLAIIFATCFALYANEDDKTKGVISSLPAVFVLTLTKDMGFALALIYAMLVFFDAIFDFDKIRDIKIKDISKKILLVLSICVVAVVSFSSWAIHMARVMSVNRFELGGERNMGMVEMVVAGITQLFSSDPITKYAIIEESMINAFFQWKICLFGSGRIGVTFISIIFIASILLAPAKHRKRKLAVYVASLIGFVAYYIFHIFLYVFIFKDNGYGLVGYTRYLSSYYTGWLVVSCISLFNSAVSSKRKNWCDLVSLCICCVFLAIQIVAVPAQNAFYSYGEFTFYKRIAIQNKADAIKDAIGEDDRIYCISRGDNGERWFMLTNELTENVIYRDMPTLDFNATGEALEQNRKEFVKYLKDHDVTHLLIDVADESLQNYLGEYVDFAVNDEMTSQDICYFSIDYENDVAYFKLIKKGTAI